MSAGLGTLLTTKVCHLGSWKHHRDLQTAWKKKRRRRRRSRKKIMLCERYIHTYKYTLGDHLDV